MTYSIWTFDAAGIAWTLGMTALLTGLVLIARKPVASAFGAKWAYGLWAIPFARLILPPLALPAGWAASFGTFMSQGTAPPAPPVLPDAVPVMMFPDTGALPPIPPAPSYEVVVHSPMNWAGLLFGLWAIGAMVSLLWMGYRHWQFMRVVDREAIPANETVLKIAAHTAEEIKYKGRATLATSLISSSPMVTGLLRPTVLLPAWFTEDYTSTEQRAAIAHELSHVRRGDLWALQAAHLFVAAQWFNPLAHLALRAFRSDQEAACDATVLRASNITPHAYGTALLKAARGSVPMRSSALAAGLPLTHALKERLTLMQSTPPTRSRKIVVGSLAALLGIAACATAAVADPAPEKHSSTIVTLSEGEIHVDGKRSNKNISITNGVLSLDGETVKDRTFILLGDPFEGTEPDTGKLKSLERLIELEVLKSIEGLESLGELEGLTALEGLGDIQVFTDMNEAHVEHLEGPDGQQIVINSQGNMNEEEIEKLRAKAQELAQRHGHLAAERKAHAQNIKKQMRIHTMRMEELDGKMEAMFGKDFEANIEASSTVISNLVDGCVEAKLDENSPTIVSSTHTINGKTFKGLCLKKGAMSNADLTTFLAENTDLTRDEITSVIRERSGTGKSSWTFTDTEDLEGAADE